jgi:hypothetical protein
MQALDPTVVQTPDLRMIDEALEWAQTTPRARLMISKPSQTGKSERAVIGGTVRALQRHPDWRTIVVTHSEDLALTHSERIRTIIQTYGTDARDSMTGAPLPDRLGIQISKAKSSAGRWQLAGHRGGLIAAGVGTALPGRPADYMLLDDLFSGMLAADSPAERRRVRTWWDTVGSQRLGPEASLVMIGTRWNEEDMHVYLQAVEPGPWRILNFPAIAEPGILDSLNRPYGEYLQNPRGETDWEAIRATKPPRVWASMYQGNPVPADGGLFNAKWFEDYRINTDPPPLYRRIVGVDPAETGQGDEAGVIAGGYTADGTVVLTDDHSGQLSSAEWPRVACLLALRTGASEVVYEAYSAAVAYEQLIKRAYDDLAAEAAANSGMVEDVRVPASRPFHVSPWKRSGNALVRSTGFRYATSNGRARVVQHRLATFEAHAIRWMESQHCPDRVAAAAIVYDVLAGGGQTVASRNPSSWGQMPMGLT